MAQTVKLKRSAVAAKVPLTSDLALGELAVNTNDGVLYTLMNDGTNKIVQLGGQAVSTTATAGTDSQGQGPLTSNLNVVTSTTANPSGVTLPTALLGKKIYIYNKGTNPINVYPASGAQIDSRGTNISIQISVNGWMEFNATSTTQWYSSASASLISPSITSATLLGTLTAGGSVGTSGQILSSTGTGVQWINTTAANTPTASNSVLDTISGSFDGVVTVFNLTLSAAAYTPFNAAQLTVVLGGVQQLPGTDYEVTGSTIIFSTAPASGLSCFIIANAGYTSVSVTDDTTTNSTYYPTFSTVPSGNSTIKVSSTKLVFNPSTGRLGIGTGSPDALLTVNGVGSFGAGSASAPSVASSGDLDTGVYFPGPDQVALATNGTGRWFVDSSGRFLVGTSSASGSNLLQVNSDALVYGITVGRGGSANEENTAIGFCALKANTTGSSNTATGWNVLCSNTTGYYNTASGSGALANNTCGYYNTAAGAAALSFNTSGNNNTATGGAALNSNSSGNCNTANGAQALYSNTTGISNTATGFGSLYENANGNFNTATGTGTLAFNTTGSYNTATGCGALLFNDVGCRNTASGSQALFNNTSGNCNTANGYRSLYCNTTSIFNTANGSEALYSNTTGSFNTANGAQALYSNTTGSENTSFGVTALFCNTSGCYNSATGNAALYRNTTGNCNTANGASALYSNSTGSYNTANGLEALYSNTTGESNTANGAQALYSNTTGSENTSFGVTALFCNTSGFFNSATGNAALYLNTTGFCNTANGAGALFSNTTGCSNIGIGMDAGRNLTTGSNNTIIGSIEGTAGLSCTVIVGAGSLERFRINSLGNMGLGTSNPTVKLEVIGSILSRAAATQDGILLAGRAGGTGSFDVTLVPATLSADRTLTVPNVTGTIVTTGDTGSVTSTMIANGTIVNEDVNASAAIDGTKINPNFGSQSVTTLGSVILDATNTPVAENGKILFRELPSNGSNTISIQGPTAIGSNVTYVLPASGPSSTTQYLTGSNPGSGNATLSWANAPGDVLAAGSNTFTGFNTFRNSSGISIDAAATQDSITIKGRAGGTGNRRIEIVPTTLSASHILTLPDVDGTVVTTGDTGTVTGQMLATNTVENADLAQVATATFKGRTTAGTGNVEDLTTTEATALLNVFTSTTKGLAPLSGGGTANFLRADGTWAAPAGGQIATMTSTQQSTTTTLADVTELVSSLDANATYRVDCFVTFQSAATTTGLNLGFTSPTGCRPMVEVVVPITSTAVASQLRTIFPNATSTTSGNVLGTGVSTINSNQTARISGIIVNGATAGNFQIRFATEVNTSAVTLQIGSILQLTRIA